MANLAASGGYWVSTPGQRIFAEPGTITARSGSSRWCRPSSASLAELGVTSDGVKTTPLSGQPDLLGGLDHAGRADAPGQYREWLRRFIGLVAKARGKTPSRSTRLRKGGFGTAAPDASSGWSTSSAGSTMRFAWVAGQAKLGDSWHPVFIGQDARPMPH
jgi:protease-4